MSVTSPKCTLAQTLGPVSAQLLLLLSAEGKNIFSIADAQAITGKSYQATAALLSQLVRKKWLVRLVPGKYLIVPLEAGLESIPMADRYAIVREVLGGLPYYVSHYSALELHQMTTQPINVVHVTVPRRQPHHRRHVLPLCLCQPTRLLGSRTALGR
jgi:predicted transcriptional regulator of viral defense system